MNRGVMLKAACELWPTTLLCGVLLLAFESILSYVLPTYAQEFSEQLERLDFVRRLVQSMVGSDLSDRFGPDTFTAIPWVHPVILAIVWAHAIVGCTRVPAGEVDRGTIDVLLGQPLSRWEIHASETVVWVGSAVVVVLMAFCGSIVGGWDVAESMRASVARRAVVTMNLFCLSLAVGGFAWLMSAFANRRGFAVTAAFVGVVFSFLLTYLGQFWTPAERLSAFSILTYHRPLSALRDGVFPYGDIAVLLLLAIGFWTAAGVTFARRDLCTV